MLEPCAQQHLCLLRPPTPLLDDPHGTCDAPYWSLVAQSLRASCISYEHAEHLSHWLELHKPLSGLLRIEWQQCDEAGETCHPDAIGQDHQADKEERTCQCAERRRWNSMGDGDQDRREGHLERISASGSKREVVRLCAVGVRLSD